MAEDAIFCPDSATVAPPGSARRKATGRARPREGSRPGRGGSGVAGLVLTPGASAGRDQSALVAIDEALGASGITVERVDFPYRVAGRRRPDPTHVLVETVVEASRALSSRLGCEGSEVAVGGRSMGGRMCSMALAEGLPGAALVAISYPLHPPGRPENRRDEHFSRIEVPCLFVSGTRDAFASPTELEAATRSIPGPVTHVWVEDGDHGLRRRDAEVAAEVAAWITTL